MEKWFCLAQYFFPKQARAPWKITLKKTDGLPDALCTTTHHAPVYYSLWENENCRRRWIWKKATYVLTLKDFPDPDNIGWVFFKNKLLIMYVLQGLFFLFFQIFLGRNSLWRSYDSLTVMRPLCMDTFCFSSLYDFFVCLFFSICYILFGFCIFFLPMQMLDHLSLSGIHTT